MSAPELILRAGAGQVELVRIPPGSFLMGSRPDEPGHLRNEGPQRRVRISNAFYIGRFEITRAQFREVTGRTPEGPAGDTLPVSGISYSEAIDFCRRLSATANLTVRLPSEAEWEYACRAGTATPYYSGSSDADLAQVGWYSENSDHRAHPVGEKQPNAWGLYDTHGNVWEFCADFIVDYAQMADTDPIGIVSPRTGAMRGGGWLFGPEKCRAATRLLSDDMFGGAGFRVAVNGDR